MGSTDEESFISSGNSSVEESQSEASVSLQLGGSVYDDAWLAPLVGMYGGQTGKRNLWQCSLMLLFVNLAIQGMVLWRIMGTGGLLDEAGEVENTLIHTEGESLAEGICNWYPLKRDWRIRGVPPPKAGEKLADCQSIEPTMLHNFTEFDLDSDGSWTDDEATSYMNAYMEAGYVVDVPSIRRSIIQSVHKAAITVSKSGEYKDDADSRHQSEVVLDWLAQSNNSVTRDIFETQVEPFSSMCFIGDPLLCGNFFLRDSFNHTAFLGALRRRGLQGMPLMYVAYKGAGTTDANINMIDVCKAATQQICPSLLTANQVQFLAVVSNFCGKPSFSSHRATVTGGFNEDVLAVRYDAQSTYTDTVLTPMYISFLALILVLWLLSMLDEGMQLITWWRVHCGLLCCSRSSAARVRCEDGAIEVVSAPKWYVAFALLMNVVPRTLIFFTLTWLGTLWLLEAASFQDLVMNGVALTFLITVDEVIYVAVVPLQRKQWIDMAKPIAPAPQPRCDWVIRHFLNEAFWMVSLAAVVAMLLVWRYLNPTIGRVVLADMVNCLCAGAGRRCELANDIGGYPDVPTALAAKGS